MLCMKNKYMLPLDVIKKILIMRPTHSATELIQVCAIEYWFFYEDSDSDPKDYIYEVDYKYFALNKLLDSRAQSKKYID